HARTSTAPSLRRLLGLSWLVFGRRLHARGACRLPPGGPLRPFRSALHGGHLARLDLLLEALEVLPHLLARLLAEEPRDRPAHGAQRRVVVEADLHLGALA